MINTTYKEMYYKLYNRMEDMNMRLSNTITDISIAHSDVNQKMLEMVMEIRIMRNDTEQNIADIMKELQALQQECEDFHNKKANPPA